MGSIGWNEQEVAERVKEERFTLHWGYGIKFGFL
jgi:hypothetical protein